MSETSSVNALITPIPNESSGKRNSDLDMPMSKKRKTTESVVLCRICQQNILDPRTKFFRGLPESGLEEETALTDDRLLLYCDGEPIPEVDIKPMHKITHFTVFDGEGHVCPFDTGLIENDQLIFFSGYIKPIYDDDSSPANGIPAQELGPIIEWWISGFDGGNSFILGLGTTYADYILMEPSLEYVSFMRTPKQKALLTKIVIEFLSTSDRPTYEELLNRLNEVSVPEDIEPLDEHLLRKHSQFIIDQIREVDDDKKQLIKTPAAQKMIKTFKVNCKTLLQRRKFRMRTKYKPTTTPLVREKFSFFLNDCVNSIKKREKIVIPKKLSKFTWEPGENSALVNDDVISVGDFVFVNASSEKSNRVYRVEFFFQQNFTKQVHCVELIAGVDTILGEASDPKEFFFLEKCCNWAICKIVEKVNVVVKRPPENWREFLEYQLKPPGEVFFVQKRYLQRHGIFENFKDGTPGTCGVCYRKEKTEKADAPVPLNGRTDDSGVTIYDKVIWKGQEYSPECCVFLESFSIVFNAQKSSHRIEKTVVTVKTDEFVYPEVYRKAKDVSLGEECPEPFVVARIKKIFSRREGPLKKLFLTVNKFYRPENTLVIPAFDKRLLDLQLLYWSNEEAEVLFEHVRGRCDVVFSKTPPKIKLHPQFYFSKAFDAETQTFTDLHELPVKQVELESVCVKKLKTLNVFAGCGGLAEGLRQSEVAEILWAVENDNATSKAFKANFPNVVMFEKDCNLFLKEVMSGKVFDENGFQYPGKGEVEFLCGGPPCQGFSVMNRFSSKEESKYNNSLVLTLLSFCDYYRPKYFLLENVRNFGMFRKSIFLKYSLSCLVAMGYQCHLGVIQAGNYGIPQMRRRLFIIAAAPGLTLPDFPKPTHVFYETLKNFELDVNGSNFRCKISNGFSGSAPYRRVTIRDAIWNLGSGEETFYGRFIMSQSTEIQDHESKYMTPLNEARIKHIPAAKGCDWRDLPNIRVRLRDGTLTDILRYSHHDCKNGKSCCGLLRGVCGCASGKRCEPKDRQNNTLIPWFLSHTANRNNNWSGLYGRLDWEGVFHTVTTNPEPAGQQGRVLHPEEDRVISVRESARAQGLPDSFSLYGNIGKRYKQVGNAVPSPVARALGCEIKASLMIRSSD